MENRVKLYRLALRCICRAKLSRFCTICLVRCASCKITRKSLRAFRAVPHFPSANLRSPKIAVSGLFTSCATRETNWPNRCHLLGMHQLGLQSGGVGLYPTSRPPGCDVPCSSRMGSGSSRTVQCGHHRAESAYPGYPPECRNGRADCFTQRLPFEQRQQGPPSGRPSSCRCS